MSASEAKQLDVSGDGGVLKEVLREGTGDDKPCSGDKVFVHYVGTLAEDGSQFDSSRDRDQKFDFVLGKGQVIKAWDMGVATMRRGELARFTCRSDYAYGDTGSPPKIPAKATLIFEVELFEWRGEDLSKAQDGGIQRQQLVEGSGVVLPNDGSTVTVDLRGSYEDRVFDERQQVTFTLGEGCDVHVCAGIETALEKFKAGEKSRLVLTAPYAFGTAGSDHFQLPANAAPIVYEVTLTSFERAKQKWEMNEDEIIEQAKLCKEKGSKYFKSGRLELAEKLYKKTVDFFSTDSEWSEEQKRVSGELKLAGHLNLALCALRRSEPQTARSHCDQALQLDAACVKALFRRGQALLAEHEPQLARADFERVLQLEPANTAARQQLHSCTQLLKQQIQQDKQRFGNIFERLRQSEQENTKNGHSELEIDHFSNGNGDATEAATAETEAATAPASADTDKTAEAGNETLAAEPQQPTAAEAPTAAC